MRLVLFQPDIPQNTGTMLRLSACFGLGVDIIEPSGFVWDNKKLARARMDYLDLAEVVRHRSWADYLTVTQPGRLVLLTTSGQTSHVDFEFHADDRLMVGRESGGVPAEVTAVSDARLRIPMQPGRRSLNVAVAAAIVIGEALRQTGGYV